MGATTRYVPRALRTAVFAPVCVAVAAGAHLAAHGQAPAVGALGVATVAVALLSAPLTGRSRGLPTSTTVMLALQVGMHVLFRATAPPMGPAATGRLPATGTGTGVVTLCTGRAGMAGMAGMAMGHLRAVPSGAAATTARTAGWAVTPWMAAGHLLAAVAASWLLHRCDEAIVTAATLIGVALSLTAGVVTRLLIGSGPLPAVASPTPVRSGPTGFRARGSTALLVNTVVRRGPPRIRLAASALAA